MGFIRKPMGEGLGCDRIAGQKVKSVIGPPGLPMTLGNMRKMSVLNLGEVWMSASL